MIHYNVHGEKRRELVNAIATWLEEDIVYRSAPSFAYEIGSYTVDRNGTLIPGQDADEDTTERLVEHLYDLGFECEFPDAPDGDGETQLDISIPADTLTDEQLENLERLITAKANLIKKAFGTDELQVLKVRDEIHFPWFRPGVSDELVHSGKRFIEKLTELAKNLKWVTAKDKTAENDKYAFRCFLLRLGFIGDEYKADRKVLLRNLNGSSAFKTGKKESA